MRWQRWVERGVWWKTLMVRKRLKRIDRQLVFRDSTVGRAHQQAAGAPPKTGDQAIGRSRGGLSTTIHTLCGSESDAVDIRMTAGQTGDAPVGEEMIDAIDTCEGSAQAAMDTAYASHAIRAKLVAKGIDPVMPPKSNRLESIVYDKAQYTQRTQVERLFNTMTQFRRNSPRYDTLNARIRGFVTLALMVIMLRAIIL
jgi:transposase